MSVPASAADPRQPEPQDLKRLSIEELMRIDVTIAGRRIEPVGTTAAAISVITGDDIRRAGVTTIADALQLADGVHVARFNNGTWRISARGFNGEAPNKLLVMIDGRTLYSPLFTGVFWNAVDYALDDIDRIEVIRGPGAALWGANAVNGVINIVTRHSRDTQGALISVSAGNEDHGLIDLRYGAAFGGTTWRAYGKFADRDAQKTAGGLSSADGRRRAQIGFRLDGGKEGATTWLLKGDAFHSRDEIPARADAEFSDLSLQGRWSRAFADASRLDVQSYYRREYRRVPQQLTHHIDVFDVDAQHALTPHPRHAVVWGGGARRNSDHTHGSSTLRFDPVSRTYPVLSLFAQDDIALLPGRLFTTLGAKYEHNAFSGGELQPSARARLLMSHGQVLWGAVSRAVRRPTRLDMDPVITTASGITLIQGTDEFKAETLIASELGYRVQPSATISLDATLFRHVYDDIRSQDLTPGGGLPLTIGNTLEGDSHGLELGANIQPHPRWRTHVSYTWLDTDVRPQPGSRDAGQGLSEANDPHHLFGLRTSVDLRRNLDVDASVRSSGALPNPQVPAYTELSLRLGWRVTPRLELSVVGQDLLHDRHPEAGAALLSRTEFERTIRAGLTLRF